MSRFTASTNTRVVQLIDTDGTTVVETLVNDAVGTNVVEDFKFTLLRQGGCGGGSLKVVKPFEYTDLTIGRYIKATYNGAAVYFGRIEDVGAATPSGWDVTTYGIMSVLSEIPIGGAGPYDTRTPQLFARSNYYTHDPDRLLQTWNTMTNYSEFIDYIYAQYLAPKGIGQGTIESPSSEVDLYALVFRGEETISQVLRAIAAVHYGASYGIDASNNFFFLNRVETLEYGSSNNDFSVFQEGVNVSKLAKKTDRSLMYNRVLLTGGYVYGDRNSGGYYRYRAPAYADTVSIATHGERPIALYLPWIRNNKEALNWLNRFFADYAGPRTRYTITTLPQDKIITPWGGAVKILNESGTEITTDIFDEVEVYFNEAPYLTLTTGVEELQYPVEPEPQRWELQQAGGGGDRVNVDGEDSHYSIVLSDLFSDIYTDIVKDIRCSDGTLIVEYLAILKSVTQNG